MVPLAPVLMTALLPWSGAAGTPPEIRAGTWEAWLQSPGGRLEFGLELTRDGEGWRAWILNAHGDERIAVPHVTLRDGELVLDIDHYDARVVGRLDAAGERFAGEWTKRKAPDVWSRLPFHARAPRTEQGRADSPEPAQRGGAVAPRVDGRWAVDFESDDQAAIGVFEQHPDGRLTGTFLTSTGDYRYLGGQVLPADAQTPGGLRLSCFDGAHAFLFEARLQADGTLAGNFWSSDNWSEAWTAVRDETVTLSDGFEQTRWTGDGERSSARFPDLDGVLHSLDDPAFGGRARLVQVFGSWCPNCHDASEYMVELDRRYGGQGLSIVGLAFEVTGDFERDAEQVRRYARRHGADWPILVAGLADKQAATEALGVLDRVRSYPTTIFMHADGRVAAVYSGFSGPATGEAHARLRRRFEGLIETLLAEPEPGTR